MSFLACTPTVFVIGEFYEILLYANAPGLFSVRVGEELYYEENSGVLSSERLFVKIRVPMAALDAAGAYTVLYRKTVERRSYFSLFEEEEEASFAFSPVPTEGDINIYYTADVHYHFDTAEHTVTYFGDALHLLIANGDLGEVEKPEDYLDVCRFLGNATGGRVPVVMARGNHDTRGRLAEQFTDYFPADGKKTYFTVSLPAFTALVLDCGEDKWDNHAEYGGGHNGAKVYNGTNVFERYRQEELAYLKALTLKKDRPVIAISHICPSMTAKEKDSIFNIEKETYAAWNRELERLGVDVMLCGHLHKTFVLDRHDERATTDNPYPVLVGSSMVYSGKEIVGTAITLKRDRLVYRFTDQEHAVREEGEILFD